MQLELDQSTVDELAAAVAANYGLRSAIAARGLPVKETVEYLKKHHRSLFKQAHEQKAANG